MSAQAINKGERMKKFNYLLPLLKRLFSKKRGRPLGSKNKIKNKKGKE